MIPLLCLIIGLTAGVLSAQVFEDKDLPTRYGFALGAAPGLLLFVVGLFDIFHWVELPFALGGYIAALALPSRAPVVKVDDDAPKLSKPPRKVMDYVAPIIGLAGFVGFWYFMSYWGLQHLWGKPSFLITPPHRVINESFFKGINRTAMLHGLYWTSFVALVGLLISILFGMFLAVLMSQARGIERAVWPYLVAMQAIPILALVPIIGNIFGFGIPSRVFVCVIISIFPIVSNTLFGLLSADRGQHDLFTLHRVSRWTRLTKLQLPNAMPTIFAGFRIAAGLSVIGAVVGEIFFVRGDRGIGILLDLYRSRLLNPQMYGALLLAAALGIVVFSFFGWLSNAVVGRWYESTRKTG